MELTPKEKAIELFTYFHNDLQNEDTDCGQEILVSLLAIRYSLKCVDEIIEALEHHTWQNKDWIKYYKEVKEEINKL
jgi:hypothetical protein